MEQKIMGGLVSLAILGVAGVWIYDRIQVIRARDRFADMAMSRLMRNREQGASPPVSAPAKQT